MERINSNNMDRIAQYIVALFQHLENMFRIEEDRQLREFYRHVADKLWADHVHDKQALFNYIYYGLVPDAPGKEQALEDALWTLQSYPTDKIFRPRMNSIRKDIKITIGSSAGMAMEVVMRLSHPSSW